MNLFDFQTHEKACLNHSGWYVNTAPGHLEEISCVAIQDPKGWNLCREVIRHPLPARNSKVAVSHM